MSALTEHQRELLREVLERRAPELMVVDEGDMTREQRLRACEVLAAEFASTGVDASTEPTGRGLELERLLDVINRANLQP